MSNSVYTIEPVGYVRSALQDPALAPRQGDEGAPEAWLEIKPAVARALMGIQVGDELIMISWLHLARRDVLEVHPRNDLNRPLQGVFATRSQDRPNPLGLHRVTVLEMNGHRLRVAPLEAIDGTPIIDLKPVLQQLGVAER